MYRIRIYRHTNGSVPFTEWMDCISDSTTKARLLKRLDKIQLGNLGDWTALGEGLCELREHFGPGFRIYFGKENREIILLLCGGDKSTQNSDIQKARQYWQEFKNAHD